jgi:hypothetical protein
MNQTPTETIGAILGICTMTIDWIRAAVENVPESRMAEQPGTLVNHPAWTLAHLNAYAGQLLAMFDDPSVPTADAEMQQFGYGTTPVADRSAYPTKSALLAQLTERYARIVKIVAEKHSDYFPRPAPARFYSSVTPTIGHVTIMLFTSHLADHFGQLRLWRRAAGLAAKK